MRKTISKTKTIKGKRYHLLAAYTEHHKADAFEHAKWLRKHQNIIEVVRVYGGWAVYYRKRDVN